MLCSAESPFVESGCGMVCFLDTGIVPSLFCWKNVTVTFYACIFISKSPLEKALPVHKKRHGVKKIWVHGGFCAAKTTMYPNFLSHSIWKEDGTDVIPV